MAARQFPDGEPIHSDWVFQRNTTARATFALKDEDGDPIDLTGTSFEAFVRTSSTAADADKVFTWPTSITDAVNGLFQMDELTTVQTNDSSLLPDNGWIVLYFTDASGYRRRFLQGILTMRQ